MLSNRAALFLAVCWLAGGLAFMHYGVTTGRAASAAYVRQLGLELTGIVVGIAIAPYEHDRGVLHVRVCTTNRPVLEPRGRQAYYYCVLRHGHADLLEGGLSEIALGDSLRVSCARDSLYVYRHGMLACTRPLYVYQTVPPAVLRLLDL